MKSNPNVEGDIFSFALTSDVEIVELVANILSNLLVDVPISLTLSVSGLSSPTYK